MLRACLHVPLKLRAGVLNLVRVQREDVEGLRDGQERDLRANCARQIDAMLHSPGGELRSIGCDENMTVHRCISFLGLPLPGDPGVGAGQQTPYSAPCNRHRRRHRRDLVPLGQEPDRLNVPRRGHIRARPLSLFQSRQSQIIRHMRHGSSSRLMVLQPICVPDPGESPSDPFSRSPYHAPQSVSCRNDASRRLSEPGSRLRASIRATSLRPTASDHPGIRKVSPSGQALFCDLSSSAIYHFESGRLQA